MLREKRNLQVSVPYIAVLLFMSMGPDPSPGCWNEPVSGILWSTNL